MNPGEERRSALVVAVSDYLDPKFRQLRSPSRDAEELARVLADPDVGPYHVETSLNEPESLVRRKLERFFTGPERRRDDLVLLHLSCHGVKDPGGELYFGATDTELDSLRSSAVSARFVTDLMRESRASRIVLFLDCCYSGAFARGFLPRSDDDVHVVEWFAGEGRAVLTASKATEYAFEGGELRDELTTAEAQPSVFTSALVKGLSTGAADRDRDGLISFDELYDYVHDEVLKATPHQTPSKSVPRMEGRLYIARSARAALLPLPLLHAVDSPLTHVRTGATYELVTIGRGADEELAAAVRETLQRLLEDEVDQVRDAARAALAELEAPAPPPSSPPEEPTPEGRETASRPRDESPSPPGDGPPGDEPPGEPPRWPEDEPLPPRRPPPRKEEPVPPPRIFRRRGRRMRVGAASLGGGLLALVLWLAIGGGDGEELAWSATGAAVAGNVLALVHDGSTGAVLAGGQDRRNHAALWTVDDDVWTEARGLGEGSVNAVALVDSSRVRAVAVGRRGPGNAERDAAVWLLEENDAREVCGATCGGRLHQEALGVAELAGSPGSLVVVGRDNSESADGLFDAAVWRLGPDGRVERLAREDPALGGPRQQQMAAVAEVDGILVAVGQDGPRAGAWESEDGGRSWTKLQDPSFESGRGQLQMLALAVRDGELVVVGHETVEGTNGGAAWVRDPAGQWERADGSAFAILGQELRSVAVTASGLVVAVGWDGNIAGTPSAAAWTSPDGRSWRRREGVPVRESEDSPTPSSRLWSVDVRGDEILAGGAERSDDARQARIWRATAR